MSAEQSSDSPSSTWTRRTVIWLRRSPKGVSYTVLAAIVLSPLVLFRFTPRYQAAAVSEAARELLWQSFLEAAKDADEPQLVLDGPRLNQLLAVRPGARETGAEQTQTSGTPNRAVWRAALTKNGRVQLAATLPLSAWLPVPVFTHAQWEGEPNIVQSGRDTQIQWSKVTHAQLGMLPVPDAWAGNLADGITAYWLVSDQIATVLQHVRSMDIGKDGLTVRFAPKLAKLLRRDEGLVSDRPPLANLAPQVRAHLDNLMRFARSSPRRNTEFGPTLQHAFRFAQRRSKPYSPVSENQAVLITLGILIGNPELERLTGPLLNRQDRKRLALLYKHTDLGGKKKLAKAFATAAAIHAANVPKRWLDAHLRGVYEHPDLQRPPAVVPYAQLAAERTGATLAQTATRDSASARMLQKMAIEYNAEAFFPELQKMPDQVTRKQLKKRYGGRGNTSYERLLADLDKRIQKCAAYNQKPDFASKFR